MMPIQHFGGESYLPVSANVWFLDAIDDPNYPKIQNKEGSIVVWGCMVANGVGKLRFINGSMDKTIYIDISHDSYLSNM